MLKKLLVVLFAVFAFSGLALAAVDLNTATVEQLDGLKGVGPAKAKAIVDYRTKNGPFKSVDDLEKVNGFGKKTVDGLRADVTVGDKAEAKKEDKKESKKDAKKAEEKKEEAKDAKKK